MIPAEVVRVVCPHGRVATFIRDGDTWTGLVSETGAVVHDDGTREPWWRMRCEQCRPDVPARQMSLLGLVLDRLATVDHPALRRPFPAIVEVPLAVMADALGASRRLPK